MGVLIGFVGVVYVHFRGLFLRCGVCCPASLGWQASRVSCLWRTAHGACQGHRLRSGCLVAAESANDHCLPLRRAFQSVAGDGRQTRVLPRVRQPSDDTGIFTASGISGPRRNDSRASSVGRPLSLRATVPSRSGVGR